MSEMDPQQRRRDSAILLITFRPHFGQAWDFISLKRIWSRESLRFTKHLGEASFKMERYDAIFQSVLCTAHAGQLIFFIRNWLLESEGLVRKKNKKFQEWTGTSLRNS